MVDTKTSGESEITELPEAYFFNIAQTDTNNFKLGVANLLRKSNTTTDLNLDANHTTPADAQIIGNLNFLDDSSTAVERTYGQLRTVIQVATNLSEEGEMFFAVIEGGTLTDYISLNAVANNQISFLKDIDMEGNDITDISNIEFRETTGAPAGTVRAIWTQADGMHYNVPTGDGFHWGINGTPTAILSNADLELFGIDLVIPNAQAIIWAGNANRRIFNNTSGFIFEGEASDQFDFHQNSVSKMTLTGTSLDLKSIDLDMTGGSPITWAGNANRRISNGTGGFTFEVETGDDFDFQIVSLTEMNFTAATLDLSQNTATNILLGQAHVQMEEQVGDPAAGTTSGKYYVKVVGGLAKPFFIGDGTAAVDLTAGGGSQTPWASTIDAANFSLTNLDILEFNLVTDTPTTTLAENWWDGSAMYHNVPAGDSFLFTINGISELQINASGITTFNGQLSLGTGQILWGAGETISLQSNDMIFDVTVGDFFSFDIASTSALAISNGLIALATDTDIQWAGASDRKIFNDSQGFQYKVQTGDTHRWYVGITTVEMELSATFLDIDAKYLELESITEPAVTAAATIGRVFMDSGNSNHLSIRRNSTTVDLEATGGGSQTPWVADIDADGFDLTDLSNIQFRETTGAPSSGVPAIFVSGGDMQFNVATANQYSVKVAGVIEYTMSASTLDLLSNNLQMGAGIIQWTGASSIVGDAGGMTLNVSTTDNYDFQVFSATEMTLNATELNLQNNKLANVNPTTITAFTTVTAVTGDFIWIIDATDGLSKKANASDFLGGGSQTPWVADIDAADFSLNNLDILNFNDLTGTPTAAAAEIYWNDTTGMEFNIPTGDTFLFDINGVNAFAMNQVGFNLLAGMSITWAATGFINVSGDMTLNVATGNSYSFEVDTTPEMTLSATTLNVQGNTINNVGNLDFVNSTSVITWSSGESISILVGDMIFDVPTTDTFSFDIAGVPEITISATQLDLKNNDIIDIGEGTITGLTTVTAATGDFAMIVDATDGLMKKVDLNDMLGGGSQTPWTSNIDAADFSLSNLDKLEFNNNVDTPVITQAEIYYNATTTGINFNVPTGDAFSFRVNGSLQLVVNATDITPSVSIDMIGNNLLEVGFVQSNDSEVAQSGFVRLFATEGVTWRNNANTLDITLNLNASDQFTFGADINLGSNLLEFADVNTTITQVGTDLEYDIATGGSHEFRINNVIELDVTPTAVNSINGAFQEAGVGISPIGLHDQYIDVGAFIPIDAGALATRIVDGGVDQKAFAFIPFANGSVEFATCKFVLPRTYNLGTLTAIIEWTSEVEGAGTVEWDVSACALGDGEDMSSVVFGTAITSTDTQTTINQVQQSPRTTAVTIGNTPADGNVIFLKIQRDGVTDTFTQPAQLLGVWIELTTDQAVSA